MTDTNGRPIDCLLPKFSRTERALPQQLNEFAGMPFEAIGAVIDEIEAGLCDICCTSCRQVDGYPLTQIKHPMLVDPGFRSPDRGTFLSSTLSPRGRSCSALWLISRAVAVAG